MLGQTLSLATKPRDFRRPEKQGLTAGLRCALVAVDRHLDLRLEDGDYLFRVLLSQGTDDLLSHQFP